MLTYADVCFLGKVLANESACVVEEAREQASSFPLPLYCLNRALMQP